MIIFARRGKKESFVRIVGDERNFAYRNSMVGFAYCWSSSAYVVDPNNATRSHRSYKELNNLAFEVVRMRKGITLGKMLMMVIIGLVALWVVSHIIHQKYREITLARFSLGCFWSIQQKRLLRSFAPALKKVLPAVHPSITKVCKPTWDEVSLEDEDGVAREIAKLGGAVWGNLGAGTWDPLGDEGNLHPFFKRVVRVDGSIHLSEVKDFLNQEFEDSQIKFVFVVPGPGCGVPSQPCEAEFIDLNTGVISDQFVLEISYSDWQVFAGVIPPFSCFRAETVEAHLDFNTRLSIGTTFGHDEGVFNYTQPKDWEDYIDTFLTSTVEYMKSRAWCELIFRISYPLHDPQNDHPVLSYSSPTCGNLRKSMVCCEDKVIVCMKET
jgi:hypothetical protein